MSVVEYAKKYLSFRPPMENKRSYVLHPDVLIGWLLEEIERLRKANTRLAEIATDAVEWLPPASVNGPREQYQNEIKELTE
jgi:hypothetical protein